MRYVTTVDPASLIKTSLIRILVYPNPQILYHYMFVNLVMNISNVVCYLNHLHVIQLSEFFTYLNKFTRPMATGVRLSEDLLYNIILARFSVATHVFCSIVTCELP